MVVGLAAPQCDDVEPGHVGGAVLVDEGELFDVARRPLGVEPARISSEAPESIEPACGLSI